MVDKMMSFTGFFLKQALYVWKCNSLEVSLWAYKIIPTHIWLCPTVGLEPRWPEWTANVSQSLSLFPRAKSEHPIQSSTATGQAGPSVFSRSDSCAGYRIGVATCISLTTEDAELLCFVMHVTSFGVWPVPGLLPLSDWVVCFLPVEFSEFFIYSG